MEIGISIYVSVNGCQQIGLEPLFPNEENPFPWMSEMIDLKKERNFLRLESSSIRRAAHLVGTENFAFLTHEVRFRTHNLRFAPKRALL